MSLQFLQPYFGLGNGLQTKNVAGGGGVGGWVELARSTSATPSVSGLANKRYYMILHHGFGFAGAPSVSLRLNSDSGSNYAYRKHDGAVDVTGVNQSSIPDNINAGDGTTTNSFSVQYLANFSTKEKLSINHMVRDADGTGAGNAPKRGEIFGKWANTASAISGASWLFDQGSANAGSEMVVLGWDPADTHSNNFWTELATNTLTSSASSIPSGTITAKKYLWVQVYSKPTGGSANAKLEFNGDTASNYAVRHSDDGAADGTQVSQTAADLRMGELAQPSFSNTFIVNTSSKEKLFISHNVNQNTAGAGNAPARNEVVGKWANTSAQITSINIVKTSGGNFDTGSTLKIWGAN